MTTASRHSLRLALTTPSAAAISGGTLLLEQESFDPYLGHLTKIAAVGWLKKMLFGDPEPDENCSGPGPGFEKRLYAYPSPPHLNYQAYLSHGSLTGPVVDRLQYEELVQVNLTKTPQLKYPAQSIFSSEWVAETYNAGGEMVVKPLVTVRQNRLRLSAEVYGTLRVVYTIERHVYTAHVDPRVEYGETSLQSFLVAVWSGGRAYIDIEAPADAKNGECKNRLGDGGGLFDYLPRTLTNDGGTDSGDSDTEGDEDNPYGPVDGEDEDRYIDYCTQEAI